MDANIESYNPNEFAQVLQIIELHRSQAVQAVNHASLLTAWEVGAYVSDKIKNAHWGAKVVQQLVEYIHTQNPTLKGWSKVTIYRMVKFYETYSSISFVERATSLKLMSAAEEIVSEQVTQIVSTPLKQIGNNVIVSTPLTQMPKFEQLHGGFMATILREKFMKINGQKETGTTQETTQETPCALASVQHEILRLLTENPMLTRNRLAEQIGMTADGIKYHLTKLQKMGLLKHVGSTKSGHWEVMGNL